MSKLLRFLPEQCEDVKQGRKTMTRRPVSGLPVFTVAPIPIWEDPEPCPACGSDQVLKMEFGGPGDTIWCGSCLDCQWWWSLETDNERDDG